MEVVVCVVTTELSPPKTPVAMVVTTAVRKPIVNVQVDVPALVTTVTTITSTTVVVVIPPMMVT